MPRIARELTPIFSSPVAINDKADEALVKGLHSQFPIEDKNYRLEISDIKVLRKNFTRADEKEAILKSKSLVYPIKATLTLTDKATGKVVDVEKDFPLMDAYHITDKHTIMYSGNNYTIANQLQLLPGCYTRSRETGELETHVNTGTGRSFSITLDPEKELFFIQVNSSSTLLAPILTMVFGIPRAEILKYIPEKVWQDNEKASQGREAQIIGALYSRMVSTSLQVRGASLNDMVVALRTALENSQLSTRTTKITLGKEFNSVQGEVILRCLKNLVDVYRGDREEDNRDSLQFKRVQNLPDYLSRRFEKEHQSVTQVKAKLTRNLEKLNQNDPKIRHAIPVKPWSKFYTSYILKSPLVSTPSETNPLESVENVGKVTVLGADEGGIGDERGVPMQARNLDPSQLGVIDPSRTPESSHAGIDQRFTIGARRDKDGTLYARVINNDNDEDYLSVSEMMATVIGFPHQEGKDMVQAQVRGKLQTVPRSEVKYWIPSGTDLYTVTTNLVPFLNSNHPGRLTMAGKAIPQALSLKNREVPLVQTVSDDDRTFVDKLGQIVSTVSQVKGTVTKITNDHIHIQTENGIHKQPLVKNLPFNMKGFMDDEKPLVKVGDKVNYGTVLADNNYTVNGQLALGKNLDVAYVPYLGKSHEDGIVISHTAAESLASHHSYKVDYTVSTDSVMKKQLVTRYYPGKLSKEQLENLDDKGFAKVGVTLKHGDPVYAVLEKREPSVEDRILARLHKNLVNPYRLAVEYWTHDEPGIVVDAHTEGRDIRILLRSVKGLEIGDKLTGLHGNKGVVSYIVPDEHMPYNKETGKPYDILFNPASVTSRINLGQIMETVAGKIAKKTGKPYMVRNFAEGNNLKRLKKELETHGLSDTDTIIDPKTGKEWKNVLGGSQYVIKLYKTTDSNYSARNVGGYDNNMQPVKGGEEGSKSVGWMEFLGLLGSDARHNLREIGTVKSEENSEFWTRFMTGQPLPRPRTTFATQKFFDYLTASGIKVNHEKEHLKISPLTDKDILMNSRGHIDEPKFLNSRNLEPEEGGLFDIAKTGGIRGKNWTHYSLAEPVVNPVFENPVKSVLGLSGAEFENITSGRYGVKHVGDGKYHMTDTISGNLIRELKVKS